ncbi:MAG TPA: SigB/SigF/SigG family RNA polymerase sigma factor [Solirubrobacteraceae bacterium]
MIQSADTLKPTENTVRQPSLAPGRTLDDLFERWQRDGDARAREQLVERFLPLARKLARRFQGAQEPIEDLVQVASLALVKAIDRFEPGRGVTFQSFAVPTIVGELKRYFRDTGWSVHVPRGAQERAVKVEQTRRRLAAASGREPTFNDLAQYLELSLEEVIDAVEVSSAHHAVSLETPREDGDEQAGTLGDSIGEVDEHYDLVETGICIEQAAKHLPERERLALALRFVGDRTQTEIASELGVSQMQVSRILRGALATLADVTSIGEPCAENAYTQR